MAIEGQRVEANTWHPPAGTSPSHDPLKVCSACSREGAARLAGPSRLNGRGVVGGKHLEHCKARHTRCERAPRLGGVQDMRICK